MQAEWGRGSGLAAEGNFGVGLFIDCWQEEMARGVCFLFGVGVFQFWSKFVGKILWGKEMLVEVCFLFGFGGFLSLGFGF